MPTQTDFELIFLGTVADIDIVETGDGSVAENAADLLGTYGSAGSPLFEQQYNAFTTDGNDDGIILEDGEGAAAAGDTLTVLDTDGTPFVFEIDSTAGFFGTVTYADGATESAGFGIIQDNGGNIWLLPTSNAASFNTKAIESISLDTVAQDNGAGLAPAGLTSTEFVCFATGTLIATPDGPRVSTQ
ncbi:hypothetical protein AB0T83_20200 [Fluviibacterium sp. DFM31]|uniref:Uncharacterized protein n=1 Tax=Meridianimarinicoccus marinus TaxID=3231483 RepID=A0ABV3LBV8_9RHOB